VRTAMAANCSGRWQRQNTPPPHVPPLTPTATAPPGHPYMRSGHKNAVLQLAWFPGGEHLVTASADKSVRCWDADTGAQVKRLNEHAAVVNSCCPMHRGPGLFVSGSDDGAVKVSRNCWDLGSGAAADGRGAC
jgi:WD40 repeat protein